MPSTVETEFSDLIGAYDPAIQILAHQARKLVLDVMASAHEKVYPGWGGYLMSSNAPESGNTVCWVTASKKHVSIGFSQGAELADPTSLLEGSGKHQRHVKIKKPQDLQNPAVRALLEAAWSSQPEAATLDAALERIRAICSELPETKETVSHGHPTFWAGKKTFAVYGLYSPSIAFKAGFELANTLEDDPRFFPTPYMAHGGWLSLKIDETTDWDFARSLLVHSFRQVATPKLLKALESRG